MRRISFDNLHQLGHKIMPLLQLYIDVGKGILPVVAKTDHPVVYAYHPKNEQDNQSEKNQKSHGKSILFPANIMDF